MTEQEIRNYCQQNGVPMAVGERLQVMDVSQLPGSMREDLDDRGFFRVKSESVFKGRLPEGFPGHAALEAEGITTYAKVRKRLDDLTKISGIGDATAEKIREAMTHPASEEEAE